MVNQKTPHSTWVTRTIDIACCVLGRTPINGRALVQPKDIDLLYLSTSFLWWQVVTGIIGVTSSTALRMNSRCTWQQREGLAKRLQHRHPPHVQPVAPVRERHCRRPRLTPEAWHRSGTLSRSGTPWWRTQKEKGRNRLTISHDAMPARLSNFRLLGMTSPYSMLVGSS